MYALPFPTLSLLGINYWRVACSALNCVYVSIFVGIIQYWNMIVWITFHLGYILWHWPLKKKLTFLLFVKCYQRFFCGGRLIFGPDVASLFLSTLLIAGPAIAFCIKIYVDKIRHHKDAGHWYPILVVGFFLSILVSNSSLGQGSSC